ncbi:hypothetical protein I4U23_004619 [Adineta vaga]|nr:hypothetical protein I4U23_004619 [Adineta vaga]
MRLKVSLSIENGLLNMIQRLDVFHRLLHSTLDRSTTSSLSAECSSKGFVEDKRLLVQFQLLMEILLRLPITEKSKNDFISWCREQYSSNPADNSAIDLFASTFKIGDAVNWYTRNSFLYRTLNQMFRTNNLRLIYRSRYFVGHLYSELKKVYEETWPFFNPQTYIYRGTSMPCKEFHTFKADKGKLVSTNCFLSATFNKNVAVCFSGKDINRTDYVSVIFVMLIDASNNKSKPFAPIQNLSTMRDEEEVLIAPGENVFEVRLVHTLKEKELEQNILHAKTIYLEKARKIESVDDFESLIDEALIEIDDHKMFSISMIDDKQKDHPSVESQSTPMIKSYIKPHEKEHHRKTCLMSLSLSESTLKYLYTEVARLRTSNTRSDGSIIFIVDQTLFDNMDDDDDDNSLISNAIICRLFPRQYIYNQCAYQIEIQLSASYPLSPPKLCFLTPIYHPNINKNDDLIDNPNIDTALSIDKALDLQNRTEFNRKAFEMAKKFGLPRQ